jgi:hypothetical protein
VPADGAQPPRVYGAQVREPRGAGLVRPAYAHRHPEGSCHVETATKVGDGEEQHGAAADRHLHKPDARVSTMRLQPSGSTIAAITRLEETMDIVLNMASCTDCSRGIDLSGDLRSLRDRVA